jgi:hypothetical protein
MYIFPLFFFSLGPCILARHFVFIWDVQTLTIVYTTFVVYGCVPGYVYGCMFGYVFGYVFGLYVWIPGLDPPRGLVQ